MTNTNDILIIDVLKRGISTRLLDVLSKKGYKNSRKPYYVDIIKFANEINVSSTMLRRYLSGIKLPTMDVVQKCATILDVDPFWLYSGYEQSKIDLDLLKQIIKRIIPVLIKSSNRSPSELDQKIEYLAEIYEHISMVRVSDEVERNKLVGWMLENILKEEEIGDEKITAVPQYNY